MRPDDEKYIFNYTPAIVLIPTVDYNVLAVNDNEKLFKWPRKGGWLI